MWRTRVTKRLGIDEPVVQAPMGGGPTTPELVAAVSNAGGLGSIAGGYLTTDDLHAQILEVRRRTDRPFAVNVFAPDTPLIDSELVAGATQRLTAIHAELDLDPPQLTSRIAPDTEGQLQLLVEHAPAAVSFTFGVLPDAAIGALHGCGCVLIGTATTVAEAEVLSSAGIDVICAQGAEAGAHRGTFLADPERSLVGLLALLPVMVDAVDVPVIAAGGIMDGRGLAAALTLGAGAAQMGTAFLRTDEAGTSEAHREALRRAHEASTVVTAAITGRLARGIHNRLIDELSGCPVPEYPAMNSLTGALRRRAAEQGQPELMALWAGQGVALGMDIPAADLVRFVSGQARSVLKNVAAHA